MRRVEIQKPEIYDNHAGPAPILDWIEIKRLVIDDRYQRELRPSNWKNIRFIARNFRWSKFSTVLVAPVEGGDFAIIDGQHRVHAAALRGFEKVPCQIIQVSSDEQANSFAAVNGQVTKITSLNLYKARLAAGDSEAVVAAKICSDAGCRLQTSNGSTASKKPGEIYAPQAFMKIVRVRNPEMITAALSMFMRCNQFNDNLEFWANSILEPTLLAVTSDAAFLASGKAPAFLEEFDIWAALDAAKAEQKRKLRLGLPTPPRHEVFRLAIVDAIRKWSAR